MIINYPLHNAAQATAWLLVQNTAYQREAELIGYPALPPLHETAEQLLKSEETLLAWQEGGQQLGGIGFTASAAEIDICRLFVLASAARRGIGRQLLQAAIDVAGARPVTVGTAAANAPVLTLYARFGFVESARFHTPDGLELVRLRRPGSGA